MKKRHINIVDSTVQRDLARFLNHRYGDGSIILRSAEDRELARIGRRHGLITDYGYITPAGQLLASEYS